MVQSSNAFKMRFVLVVEELHGCWQDALNNGLPGSVRTRQPGELSSTALPNDICNTDFFREHFQREKEGWVGTMKIMHGLDRGLE